jgi:cell division protein FtsN
MHRLALLAPVLLLAAVAVEGQVPTPTPDSGVRPAPAIPRPANDSIFRRARRLVSEGNGAAGRALVDSILQTSNPATPAYGEALYWHGALAPTAAEAERDYRRVIVEYPLSYYADDALLSIAELEQARGDRAGALQHLQRFVREHPASSARGIAALGAARLAFEQRDQKTACAMLTEARTAATSADVELRNQIDYYSGRCTEATAVSPPSVVPSAPANTSSPVAVTPTTASAPAAPAHAARPPAPSPATTPSSRSARSTAMPGPATRAPTSPREKFPPAKPSAGASRPTAYTIQVAAYNTQSDAERLVTKLATRGVKARVSGTSKPFRVRLGLYETRQEANKEVAALKRRGIIGFVAEEARPANGRSP